MISLPTSLSWHEQPKPPSSSCKHSRSSTTNGIKNSWESHRCVSHDLSQTLVGNSGVTTSGSSDKVKPATYASAASESARRESFPIARCKADAADTCDHCDMRARKLPDSATSSINDTWPRPRSPLDTVKTFKVLLIGNSGVGKTSFVLKYVYGRPMPREYKCTLGVDFALKEVRWSQDITIKLQLWDIAGQERFASMTRVYYKDAHACIIMFDLSQKRTFFDVLKWKNDLDNKCLLPSGEPIPCILLANKCDLGHREVTQSEIENFCKEHNFIGWTEVSVKNNLMVDESMKFLMKEMMLSYSHDSYSATDNPNLQSITLHNSESPKSKCLCS